MTEGLQKKITNTIQERHAAATTTLGAAEPSVPCAPHSVWPVAVTEASGKDFVIDYVPSLFLKQVKFEANDAPRYVSGSVCIGHYSPTRLRLYAWCAVA